MQVEQIMDITCSFGRARRPLGACRLSPLPAPFVHSARESLPLPPATPRGRSVERYAQPAQLPQKVDPLHAEVQEVDQKLAAHHTPPPPPHGGASCSADGVSGLAFCSEWKGAEPNLLRLHCIVLVRPIAVRFHGFKLVVVVAPLVLFHRFALQFKVCLQLAFPTHMSGHRPVLQQVRETHPGGGDIKVNLSTFSARAV